jgi:hypothetical protein
MILFVRAQATGTEAMADLILIIADACIKYILHIIINKSNAFRF